MMIRTTTYVRTRRKKETKRMRQNLLILVDEMFDIILAMHLRNAT